MALVRTIDVNSTNINSYIDFLYDFFGRTAIDKKLIKLKQILKHEKGLYGNLWVIPNQAFWIGVRDLTNPHTDDIENVRLWSNYQALALSTVAKLITFKDNIPAEKLNYFRSSFLKEEYLTPIIYELDVAAHFWQQGYDLRWLINPREQTKIPEYIAFDKTNEIEIECKTKMSDAGRKILKKDYYRLIEELKPLLEKKNITGEVVIVVEDKLPKGDSWRKRLVEAVKDVINRGSNQIIHLDKTKVVISLDNSRSTIMQKNQFLMKMEEISDPYSFVTSIFQEKYNIIINPIFIKVVSLKRDEFLKSIYDVLKDASHQFTGTRCAIISCFIPEVDSFKGLGENSGLNGLIRKFLADHPKKFLSGISFTSDPHFSSDGNYEFIEMPSITFYNSIYDANQFGPYPRIYG